jgi:spermidine synthase
VFQEIYGCFYSIFGQEKVFPYLLSIPTYPSGTWSAAYCSKGKAHPLEKVDFTRIEKFSQRHKLQYYNADVHKAAFALPNYVRNLLKAAAESVNPEGTAA